MSIFVYVYRRPSKAVQQAEEDSLLSDEEEESGVDRDMFPSESLFAEWAPQALLTKKKQRCCTRVMHYVCCLGCLRSRKRFKLHKE